MINPFDFSLIQAKTLLIIVLIMFSSPFPWCCSLQSGNKRLITTTWVLFDWWSSVISLYLLYMWDNG